MTQGQMTYHLRRLRLHAVIERIPKSHRYRVTERGWRIAFFCTRTYNRILRPGLAEIIPKPVYDSSLGRRFDQLDEAINQWLNKQRVPA
jgi:hypothetical protein